MSDNISQTLGEIKGTLVQFQRDTERRFDELKEGMEAANNRAITAEKRADEAHEFAKLLVQKAGFMGGVVSFVLVGIIWVFEHIPTAIAAITRSH